MLHRLDTDSGPSYGFDVAVNCGKVFPFEPVRRDDFPNAPLCQTCEEHHRARGDNILTNSFFIPEWADREPALV